MFLSFYCSINGHSGSAELLLESSVCNSLVNIRDAKGRLVQGFIKIQLYMYINCKIVTNWKPYTSYQQSKWLCSDVLYSEPRFTRPHLPRMWLGCSWFCGTELTSMPWTTQGVLHWWWPPTMAKAVLWVRVIPCVIQVIQDPQTLQVSCLYRGFSNFRFFVIVVCSPAAAQSQSRPVPPGCE